jgi:DNA adenine methylase
MYFLNKKYNFSSVSFEDESLYQNLEKGDVVYFDPPYIPISDTASFTDYATEGFNHQQQIKLAEIAKSLANKNVKVIISNHDVPIARELYQDAEIYSIQVTRTISAKGSSRKKASELIAVF